MKNKVIRKKDKYNFCISEVLDEPKIVKLGNKEVVYKYKDCDIYIGDMYYAIRALIRHDNLDLKLNEVPESLKDIKVSGNEDLYMPFLEVGHNEILKLIEKEY